jgi:hypothetical protein
MESEGIASDTAALVREQQVSTTSNKRLSAEISHDPLTELGYLVVPILAPSELQPLSEAFFTEAMRAPELRADMSHDQFVLGGIGYVPFASLWCILLSFPSQSIQPQRIKQLSGFLNSMKV